MSFLSPVQQVIADIEQVSQQYAQEYGVNAQELTNISLATAMAESGLNPTDVGDNGTSFGLFQLHEGGELGSLTPQQAFNPLTNARVAIAQIADTLKNNPNADPGDIAAMAQRPLAAFPNGSFVPGNSYSQKVDALYQQVQQETGIIGGAGNIGNIFGKLFPILGTTPGNVSGAVNAGQSGLTPGEYFQSQITGAQKLTSTWPALLVGLIVIGIGLVLVLADHQQAIQSTASKVAEASA